VKSGDTDTFFASHRMEAAPRGAGGFSQKDFALRNAACAISDIISDRSAETRLRKGMRARLKEGRNL